jgi:hypothetical protein
MLPPLFLLENPPVISIGPPWPLDEVPVALPAANLIRPPSTPTTSLLVVPADNVIDPAFPVLLIPTKIDISPELPPTANPVERRRCPEFPEVVLPDSIIISPLLLIPWESAVLSVIRPELDVTPSPDDITTFAPVLGISPVAFPAKT